MQFVSTVLCKMLVNARVLSMDVDVAELKSVWFRCQALFVRFIEAATKMADEVWCVVLLLSLLIFVFLKFTVDFH